MEDQELAELASARVGTVLKDKWTIEALVGVGGMASVYAATHRNQKRVAIKMLHPELSQNVEVRTRFLREGYVANTVGHRGAVVVHDDDITEDGAAFLVMELLEGETLEARRARKGGRLASDEVLSLVDQLLDVLAAAHGKGVVHRDLKPENLFFTQEGVLKVLDFGIARLRDGSAETAGRSATRAGSVMGTPAFMAPEQARARWELVDGQTDLWAVGATMYTLLSGRFVREGGTVNEELAQAITAPAASLTTVAPDLEAPVVELVDRALAFDKAVRWPDAAAMQVAVRLAYHALSGHEGGGEDAPAVASRAPRAVMPSGADRAIALGAADANAPTVHHAAFGTSLSQPGSTAPIAPTATARWSKVGIAGAVVAAMVTVAIVALRGGGSREVQPATLPDGEAPVAAQPIEPSANAEPSVTAASSAEPTDPAEPSSTAPVVDPTKTAVARAPRLQPKPPRPAESAKPPGKRDPLGKLESFLKKHQLN